MVLLALEMSRCAHASKPGKRDGDAWGRCAAKRPLAAAFGIVRAHYGPRCRECRGVGVNAALGQGVRRGGLRYCTLARCVSPLGDFGNSAL